MTIAFLPWPTSIYFKTSSQHASSRIKSLDRFPSCSSDVNDTLAGAAYSAASKPAPLNRSDTFFNSFELGVIRTDTEGEVRLGSVGSLLSPLFFYVLGNRISKVCRPVGMWYFSSSHLTGRDELQGAQGDLEVSGVGLEVVESLSDALLELGGVLPRRAVGGDLVQGLGGHFGGDAQRTVLDEDRGT